LGFLAVLKRFGFFNGTSDDLPFSLSSLSTETWLEEAACQCCALMQQEWQGDPGKLYVR
jgi:hypothetical protein